MKRIILYTIIMVIPILLWIACYHYIPQVINETDVNSSWTHRGQLGDMFGIVNALFSGLAFAGLIITIIMQRDELSLQREELKLTRDEMQDTRKEFEQQNTTLKRQRFESTFFNMLTIHFKLLETLRDFQIGTLGVNALQTFTNEFNSHIQGLGTSDLKEYQDKYLPYFNENFIHSASHYIQSLVSLHTIIKESNLKPKAEKRYLNLLKSYISLPERRFLYYHILLGNNSGLRSLEKDLHIVREFPALHLINANHILLLKHLDKLLEG